MKIENNISEGDHAIQRQNLGVPSILELTNGLSTKASLFGGNNSGSALGTSNNEAYIPTGNYNPATKSYVDADIFSIGVLSFDCDSQNVTNVLFTIAKNSRNWSYWASYDAGNNVFSIGHSPQGGYTCVLSQVFGTNGGFIQGMASLESVDDTKIAISKVGLPIGDHNYKIKVILINVQ